VFVQPYSEQRCLLGMNVLPSLGLRLCRANGASLIVRENTNPVIAHVRVVQSTSIPSLKGSFVRVRADDAVEIPPTSHVLFEPLCNKLELAGLSSHKSMVSFMDDKCLLAPM